MKIKILKDVYSVKGWLKEGDVVSMNQKMANLTSTKILAKNILKKNKSKKLKKSSKIKKKPKKIKLLKKEQLNN